MFNFAKTIGLLKIAFENTFTNLSFKKLDLPYVLQHIISTVMGPKKVKWIKLIEFQNNAILRKVFCDIRVPSSTGTYT